MKITVTFDSLEEFQQHMTTGKARMKIAPEGVTVMPDAVITPAVMPDVLTTPAVVESVPVAAETPEAPKPEKKPKKAEKPAEKPAEAPEEKPAEAPAVTTEQVRKLLADLNKKAGKNIAKELIRQVGYKKLTDVPEEALPTLQCLVEEEAKNYA